MQAFQDSGSHVAEVLDFYALLSLVSHLYLLSIVESRSSSLAFYVGDCFCSLMMLS